MTDKGASVLSERCQERDVPGRQMEADDGMVGRMRRIS